MSQPLAVTTGAAILAEEALGETQLNALYDWAFGVYLGLYPVDWRWQPVVQPTKPKIVLNATLVRRPGLSDDIRADGEALGGARVVTVSVSVSSDPQPPTRALALPTGLVTGSYTITVNGTPYTVTYGSAPASLTVVSTALLALLDAAGFPGFLYGTDLTAQGVAFENVDPRGSLTVTAGANMGASTYTPPKASTIAQRLNNSLGMGNNSVRDALALAGLSPGTVNDVSDISTMLETRSELRAVFDFYVNAKAVLPISGPIIDTVTSVDGTVTP